MFSIENLAWRDVQINENEVIKKNGNSEEKVIGGTLTKEQRGPNGGRIMWFPPYNLKFSEDVVTNWNANTFIGRGENMYTYVNTERGGSLSFTLLIDHPSIVNAWTNASEKDRSYEREQQLLRFFAGCDDIDEADNKTEETNEQQSATTKDSVEQKAYSEYKEIKIPVFFPNDYSGVNEREYDAFFDYLYKGDECVNNIGYESSSSPSVLVRDSWYTNKHGKTWKYKVDSDYKEELLSLDSNYIDEKGYYLNNIGSASNDVKTKLIECGYIRSTDVYKDDYYSFLDLCRSLVKVGNISKNDTWLDVILGTEAIKNIDQIEVKGFSTSHGYINNNNVLAKNRAETLKYLILNKKPDIPEGKFIITEARPQELAAANKNVSSLEAKLYRAAEVIIKVNVNKKEEEALNINQVGVRNNNITSTSNPKDAYLYDNEYTYFRDLKESDSITRDFITEKVRFFDPAFHSITPEGFNARLTFLHQCTRQGPTVSASDANNKNGYTGVGNLAFGRAPYCVLRIGDFYNTKILIESISINYDTGGATQWDLNPEGVGVQPMMAEVQIRFKFVGGTDISGPIERLQNAVSFNYYSNASIYDRRADYRNSFIDGDKDVHVFNAVTQGNDTNKQGNNKDNTKK